MVDAFARRLQMQEKMIARIAGARRRALKPRGVAVALEGERRCMSARGVHKRGATTVASTLPSDFRSPETRREFLGLIGDPASRGS